MFSLGGMPCPPNEPMLLYMTQSNFLDTGKGDRESFQSIAQVSIIEIKNIHNAVQNLMLLHV